MKKLLFLFAAMLTVGMSAWADGDWTIIEQPTCYKYGTMQKAMSDLTSRNCLGKRLNVHKELLIG